MCPLDFSLLAFVDLYLFSFSIWLEFEEGNQSY